MCHENHVSPASQAVHRGKVERRRVFEEMVLPGLLARGLQQKRRLEGSRSAMFLASFRVDGQSLSSASAVEAADKDYCLELVGSLIHRCSQRLPSAAGTKAGC